MIENIIKLIIGTGITTVLPVFFIEQCKKKKYIWNNDFFHRNLLFYITIAVSVIIGILFENNEYIMGVLIGSVLLHIMGISGVGKMISPEQTNCNVGYHGYFCAFSMVILLFLGGDYLLQGVHTALQRVSTSQNVVNRFDGLLLLLLFILYIFIVFKNVEKKIEMNIRQISRTILLYIIITIIIVCGSLLVMHAIVEIGVETNNSQYKMALIIGTWCLNLSYIIEARKENAKEIILEESYIQTIVIVTLFMGVVAVTHSILIGAYIMQDFILVCVMVVLLQFLKKIDNRIIGSLMATAYVVSIISILIR